MSLVLGGVCALCNETRGGQYFAAEGREIEGPPLPLDVFGSFPNPAEPNLHLIIAFPICDTREVSEYRTGYSDS